MCRIPERLLAASLSLLAAGVALSQDFPAKPLRIITADTGSTNDLVARLIAQGLTGNLGQQVIVENRGGASGLIAAQALAKAPPDGYTLLLYSSTLWIGPLLQDLSANPIRDFAPITLAASSPNLLAVHPSLPVKSVKDLIALAKRRPGELNYGSSSLGSSNHLGAELFKSIAQVNIVRVNYKGGGGALSALMAGEVQLMFVTSGLVSAHLKAGRLRALGICSLEPSTLYPGMPTVAASGLPGFESSMAPSRRPGRLRPSSTG
jgi:tripartite-type tricarboxylate transporter receptor subunit TctC